MATKDKKEKKAKGIRGSEDGATRGKKAKERGPREPERSPPSSEALQAALTSPIVVVPLSLDGYCHLIDSGARAVITTVAQDTWTYADLSRTLISLETQLSSVLARLLRDFAEPLRQKQGFPANANSILFGQIEPFSKISGRLIGVYESSSGLPGAIERIRRKLGDTESAYCTFAHSFAQITSTIFNLQQDKAFADVLKPDSKAGLSTLLGALLHYPSHYFALWRRLKLDELKACPDATRLVVELERFAKSVRVQYENGHNTLKIHELNARLINPDQAALLAGGDLRQLLAQFSAKIGGVKKEIVVLNDGIMVLKQVSSSDNKLEYESLTPIAEVSKLEVSPATSTIRIITNKDKTIELLAASTDVGAVSKALTKAVPRITESVILSNSGDSEPLRKESKDMSGETSGERSGKPTSASKTPESPLLTPAAATPGVTRTSVEVKDTTKGPMEAKDGKKTRAVTPKKDSAPSKEPTARLKAEGREGTGKSPVRGMSPLRKRPETSTGVGEDEIILHEEEMSSDSEIINTEEDAPAAPEKEPVKSSEGEKKETKEGWGDMIVSFFKGEQNVAAVKKRTDPSHKLPVMIQSVEDFPREIKSLLKSSGVAMEKFDKNLTVLTNVLYFTTHRNFVTKESREKRRADKKANHAPVLSLSELPPDAPAFHFKEECEAELAKEDNPRRLYKLAQQAGKGGFGKVYDARLAVANGRRVAIKRMPNVIEKDRLRNQTEIGALKLCKHPNIVDYIAAHRVSDEIWLVMEFMEGGTLTEAAKAHIFTEKEIAFVSREILKAIQFLHAKMLVHRDLKSSNVMMSTSGEIKLIDFGLCCDIRTCRRGKMAGSPYWMPPEMITRQQYGLPIDIWSFAVCIIELANRNPPNKSNPIRAMFLTATEGIRDPLDRVVSWSPEIRDFLSLCLHNDPEKRATATQLLGHAFVGKAEHHKNMEKVLSSIFLHNTLAVLGTGFG